MVASDSVTYWDLRPEYPEFFWSSISGMNTLALAWSAATTWGLQKAAPVPTRC